MKFLVLFALVHVVVGAVEFQFLNTLPGSVWVGSQGNKNETYKFEDLMNGGWVLNSGQKMSVYAADNWAGRFWGRSWCNAQTQHCLTGDCGNKLQCNGAGGTPPATLLEITLKGSGGLDYYDVSLVDGFNVEVSFQPLNGQGDGSQYSCTKVACLYHILSDCPAELQLKGDNGQVVGCKSACTAYDTDEYCCRGSHSTPETCKSTDWQVNYPKFFKDRCPDAYSYAYDDHKSTFTCKATKYLITFGAP